MSDGICVAYCAFAQKFPPRNISQSRALVVTLIGTFSFTTGHFVFVLVAVAGAVAVAVTVGVVAVALLLAGGGSTRHCLYPFLTSSAVSRRCKFNSGRSRKILSLWFYDISTNLLFPLMMNCSFTGSPIGVAPS